MTNESKIVAGICLFFFIIIAFLFWKGPSLTGPATVTNTDLLVRDTSHMTGKKGAKVTIVEFGDYQCPACGAVYPELQKAIDSYKNNPDFNFVFRNFPLPQHQNAQSSAEAAEAAGAQGKYFDMEGQLYTNQSEWSEATDTMPLYLKYAKNIGLDTDKFSADLTNHKFASVVSADLNDGNTLRIDHTPTVFINGTEQTDLSFAAVKATVDSLLAK